MANDALVSEPIGEEIHEALFQMHPNKAPGIDDMHAIFYHKCWYIIKEDVVSYIKSWWKGDVDIELLNKTCIVLIPKCPTPKQKGDFRPISLCIVLYKMISKMMANRIKV